MFQLLVLSVFLAVSEIIFLFRIGFVDYMRITRDAIDELDSERLREAVRNAESEDRKTIRAEDLN